MRRPHLKSIPALLAATFLLTSCSKGEISGLGFEEGLSSVNDQSLSLWQWSWQFNYKDAGEYKSATVTGTPAQPPTLYLPLGENVRFTLNANDVVHGFWIPAFMIQMQNLPGVTNQLEFSANKLGTFPGRCNILCGRNHSQMLFTVKVVTPTEYQTYIEGLVAEEKAAKA